MIPPIVHQIWLGADPLPEEFRLYGQSWVRHNPGWELRLWTEETVPDDLTRREVYERLRQPAERSDILRLELLQRHGGIYIDTDFECLRPFGAMLDGVDFFCGYLKPDRVNNAIIGAAPGHPIVAQALRELRPRTFFGVVDKEGTGPLLLNRVLRDHPDVVIFDRAVFYPQSAAERENAVGVHHAAQSWKDDDGLRKEVRRLQKLLARAQAEADAAACRAERVETALGSAAPRHRRFPTRLRRFLSERLAGWSGNA